MKIKLICDSLCDIPREIEEKDYVHIAPLTVVFEGVEYKDNIDFTREEFYDLLRKSNEIPTTSQVTYMEFKNIFEKYLNEGYEILCITGASKSSGTYQSAVMAREDLDEKEKIRVFDTMNLSLGSAQYVIKATELIESGMKLDKIIDELEDLRKTAKLLLVPGNLKYLKKSGRTPAVTAIIGNVLNIKPIIFFNEAVGEIVDKVRGKKHVASRLVDIILQMNDNNVEDMIITIGYGDNFEDFEKLEEEVKKRLKPRRLLTTRAGSVISCHTGPDILAISCSK